MMQNGHGRLLTNAIIALGVVYGDIGTSPLYTMNALINDVGGTKDLTEKYIIGCLSLVFWTLMLMTTVKYVLIAMQANNKGEGGIFALYALVRKYAKWLIIPALVGGAALLADGTITPAVTVTSSIEGLKGVSFGTHGILVHNQGEVIVITLAILLILFSIQRFGTSFIGRAFGPIMIVWFGFLAVFGLKNIGAYPMVFRALLPHYGIELLFDPHNKDGIFILGSVFLATTGAEALYSDMGHVGSKAIYVTWPIVFVSLTLNYFGQGAFLISHLSSLGTHGSGYNPFYQILPQGVYLFGVILATLAAIIASQALITGSFTLVEEAIGLKLLPRLPMEHPSLARSQIYISPTNWMLCVITCSILLFFQTSAHMEAAYGLSITITMLMTSLLLHQYLLVKSNRLWATVYIVLYASIEIVFLIASLSKFVHGGYVTLLLTCLIVMVMIGWYYGNKLRTSLYDESEYLCLDDYKQMLQNLSNDDNILLYVSNLVMMARINNHRMVKRETLYSILDKNLKRAKVYWFVTVNTTDEPYTSYYTVDMMGTRNIVNLQLYLGFKMGNSVNMYLRQVVSDLMSQGVIDKQPQEYTTDPGREVGDFRFVIIRELLDKNTAITGWRRGLIQIRIWLQNHTVTPVQFYGLEFSDTVVETVPLFLKRRVAKKLRQNVIANSCAKID